MLVLSRKVNEEIVIGDNIKITVVRVVGNRIRLGISAPGDVTIKRGEIAFDSGDFAGGAGEDCNSPHQLSMC